MSQPKTKLVTESTLEDTLLVGEGSNEILTEMNDWPVTNVQIGDQIVKHPTILEAN